MSCGEVFRRKGRSARSLNLSYLDEGLRVLASQPLQLSYLGLGERVGPRPVAVASRSSPHLSRPFDDA